MTYKEQEKEALKLISKYGRPWMLSDNEAIGEVIGAMIRARLKYNPAITKGSTYMIRSAINKMININKIKSRVSPLNILPQHEPYCYSKQDHLVDYIKTHNVLSDREKEVLIRSYFRKERGVDIAKSMNVSRQRVKQNLESALEKLKEDKHVLVEK